MRVLFMAVNAKYIHTSPAVRILCKVSSQKYDASFLEASIKDNIENIVSKAIEFDAIGLSCYIWNIEIMKKISKRIKEINPSIVVFAGGPEVGYEPQSFVDSFDYVLCGEGEEIIVPFLDYVCGNSLIMPEGVADKNHQNAIPQIVSDLNNVPDIFDMYTEDDRKNRIIYLETSRGCPFKCSYCLSSVEKSVRLFDEQHNENIFQYINTHYLKCVKFLDRTFNIKPERFLEICHKLEDTNNTYQFEIQAELFNDEVIDYLVNKVTFGKFRLEVGIQSFNKDALNAIDRNQDNERLISIISQIQKAGRCTIHADLIAGLPNENLESFICTFNKAFLLGCEELQLGFLKMLRGTKIRNEAQKYEYEFSDQPPYEVMSNMFVTKEEFDRIHNCEHSLDWMWNQKRAVLLINKFKKDCVISNWFEFFEGFSKYYDSKASLDKNYEKLCDYLSDLGLLNVDVVFDLKKDYLSTVRVRPKFFWSKYYPENIRETRQEIKEKYPQYFSENCFVTRYYEGYLLIKYQNGESPILFEI